MSDEQHPLAKFEQELMMAMTDYSRAALIVGLRFNTGGDGNLAREMMTTLQNVCVSQNIRYYGTPNLLGWFISFGSAEALG